MRKEFIHIFSFLVQYQKQPGDSPPPKILCVTKTVGPRGRGRARRSFLDSVKFDLVERVYEWNRETGLSWGQQDVERVLCGVDKSKKSYRKNFSLILYALKASPIAFMFIPTKNVRYAQPTDFSLPSCSESILFFFCIFSQICER